MVVETGTEKGAGRKETKAKRKSQKCGREKYEECVAGR